MINIREEIPIKMSGLTSFFISFSYNELIINALKKLDIYSYDRKTKVWEIPQIELSQALDTLTYIDDINLILLPEPQSKTENPLVLINKYKTKPFDYQLEGIKYGLNHNKWLLLDAPGLGKTLEIIYLAEELKAQRGLQHCLIICGINTLKTNWKKEITKHSSLDCKILGEKISKKNNVSYGSIDERAEELKKPIKEFFIIVNIESFLDRDCTITSKRGNVKVEKLCPLIEALNTSINKIDMVVVDEVHRIKDKQSIRAKNLLKIDATYKIAATGTLLLNNPLDTYVPLYWTNNDHATLTNFKKEYCEFGEGFGGYSQVVGFKNLTYLKDELDNCSLRRTKDSIKMQLPPKNIVNEYVDLNDEHRKFYDDIKDGVREVADKIELKTSSLLALVTRLRQASILPSLLTTKKIEPSKITRCCDLVEQMISQGDKVVIMSTFKEPVYLLAELLKEYKPLLCVGDQKEAEVSKNIDEFQNDDEHKVFIGTYSKASTGITLNRATYMICLDECWTAAQNIQAQDRIHRVTNTKPVFIYNLIANDTIDEHVHELAQLKKDMSDYIVDGKYNEKLIENLRKIIKDL